MSCHIISCINIDRPVCTAKVQLLAEKRSPDYCESLLNIAGLFCRHIKVEKHKIRQVT
jgi:hypothetical protein